jgi:hypothetical protein
MASGEPQVMAVSAAEVSTSGVDASGAESIVLRSSSTAPMRPSLTV